MPRRPNCCVLLRTLLLTLTISANFLGAGCRRTTPSASVLTPSASTPTHSATVLTSAQKAYLKKARLNQALVDAVAFDKVNIPLVKRLLNEGANPTAKVYNQATNQTLSAYQFAIEGSNADLVALFLDRGTPVNFYDTDDDPNQPKGALDWAASRQADARTMRVLLAHGADRRYLDHAISTAAGVADPVVVRCLLDAGAHVNSRYLSDGWGMTPLITAVAFSDAAEANTLKTMRLLLSRGANVNARDSHGMTALMWAAGNGDEGRVRLLLAHKANLRLVDVWGETALGRAKKYNQPAMVQLLQKAGAKK